MKELCHWWKSVSLPQPLGNTVLKETNLSSTKNKPYLKMRPSLAMEYNILGNGRSAPSRDDVSPQRPPIAITYLAHGAPFKANTLGNVASTGRAL